MFRFVLYLGLLLSGAQVFAPQALSQQPPPVPPPMPPRGWHALNPSHFLRAPAATPLEQQMQQNYRTELMQAQRELQQANPSGMSRDQIAIGHELDGYNPVPR